MGSRQLKTVRLHLGHPDAARSGQGDGEDEMKDAPAPIHLAPSVFNRLLIRWNSLGTEGFAAWEFLPGMRFSERTAWWRGGADRASAHEGLDLICYRTVDGRRGSLAAGARVPAIYGGEVVSVVDDFLGASVFLAHAGYDGDGRRLHTIYGHLRPRPGLAPGSRVEVGEAVGTIAGSSAVPRAVPPHLHITLALIAPESDPKRLDWDALRDRSRVLLLDPMIIMK